MAQFTKEELLTIAQLSALRLDNQEIETLSQQIATILNYVDQLAQVTVTTQAQTVGNKNVFRDDVARKSNADLILEQAPKKIGRYFVVPKILD
jgi:aspartyl-tRNA(Asn)/glutamyl-tRNA(Gln) amidotransferase subunit C